MACPYFVPAQELVELAFTHPQRLPLGSAWNGTCSAPGHEGTAPGEDALKSGCNLGYARGCTRLPENRAADAVRFAIVRERGDEIDVCFAFERSYLPAGNGVLTFKRLRGEWAAKGVGSTVALLAKCFLESYFRRRVTSDATQ